MRWEWPWRAAERRMAAMEAAASAHVQAAQAIGTAAKLDADRAEAMALEAKAHWQKALQCALAAGEAAGLAVAGGVGDGAGRGLDDDLETLDTHTFGRGR